MQRRSQNLQTLQGAISRAADTILQPTEPAKEVVEELRQQNLRDMALPSRYQKILKEVLKKPGLEALGFSIKNDFFGHSNKYKYTLISNNINTKRFLFLINNSVLQEPKQKNIVISLGFAFRDNNVTEECTANQDNIKAYIFYKITPHPVYKTIINNTFKELNIDVKLNYLQTIKDLENYCDEVSVPQLETLLDLRVLPPAKICGELIKLQEIIESLPAFSEDGQRGWISLLDRADPRLRIFFEERNIDLVGAKRLVVQTIVNTLNRDGKEYGGLQPLLETISKLEDLPRPHKKYVDDILKRYFPKME